MRTPRGPLRLFIFPLLLLITFSVAGQEELILQRVYIAPFEAQTGEAGTEEFPALYREAPEILYRLITTEQPVVRVESPENAHSIIECSAETTGFAEEEADEVVLLCRLRRDNEVVAEAKRRLPLPPSHDVYDAALEETAGEFAQELGRVPPRVSLSQIETDRETEELLDQILFEEANAGTFEAALWTGIASKGISGSDEGDMITFVVPTHFVGEFSWFPSKNHGITGNLLFSRNDIRSYGRIPGSDDDDDYAKSNNTLLLPGVGYTYRTLGKISGGLFIGYSVGAAQIEALEPLDLHDGTTLEEGEKHSWLAHALTLRPFLTYSITPQWSLKSSVVFFLDPALLVGGESQLSLMDLQVLNFCVSYGWD